MDAREHAADDMHKKLNSTQQSALWYLARLMGRTELRNILHDFAVANGEIAPDHPTIADVIDFYYTR